MNKVLVEKEKLKVVGRCRLCGGNIVEQKTTRFENKPFDVGNEYYCETCHLMYHPSVATQKEKLALGGKK